MPVRLIRGGLYFPSRDQRTRVEISRKGVHGNIAQVEKVTGMPGSREEAPCDPPALPGAHLRDDGDAYYGKTWDGATGEYGNGMKKRLYGG